MFIRIEEIKPKIKPKIRYVLKNNYGYWHSTNGCFITGTVNELREEDLFITRIGAFVSRFDLIFNHDCKIVKVKVYGD